MRDFIGILDVSTRDFKFKRENVDLNFNKS